MKLRITDKPAVLKYNPAFGDLPDVVDGLEFRPAFAVYVCTVACRPQFYTLKVKREHCRPARRRFWLFGAWV